MKTQKIQGAKADDRPIKKILLVEDSQVFIDHFISAFKSSDMNIELTYVKSLYQAEGMLKAEERMRGAPFDAIITDCGFPGYELMERDHDNKSGLFLIERARKGEYGEPYKTAPIAFNSRERPVEKYNEYFPDKKPDNVQVFSKGAIIRKDDGQKLFPDADDIEWSYTDQNVASQTLEWLSKKLYPQLGKAQTLEKRPVTLLEKLFPPQYVPKRPDRGRQ